MTVRREDWRDAGSNRRQSGIAPPGAPSFKAPVVVIPKGLVPRGAEEATVRVAGPNGSEPRPIRIGLGDDQHLEVTAGLKAGGRGVWSGRPR
ncbi:MAG: efflux RND transporter periplasmic adaptor subunit [Candidatus Rokubacteria bacterium]|nr:efflux RND transporter periplasmic adaptor subunit [Candidatus Rokubacteria bacterium]